MITLLITLVILGVVLYLIEIIPMDATVKTIIRIVGILFVVLYLLQALGVWHGFPR